MGGGRKRRERDGDRKRADVHLSCIIVLNASTAVLVLETMWGMGRLVLLKSQSDFAPLLPLLFSDYINTHTHTHNPRMNSSGRSQPSSFLWTKLFLNKVLMALTSSSNKPFPPIREDCGAGLSQGLWVLQRKRPDSPWLLPHLLSVFPLFLLLSLTQSQTFSSHLSRSIFSFLSL